MCVIIPFDAWGDTPKNTIPLKKMGLESDPQAVYGEYIAIYDSTDKTVYRVDGWSLYDSDIK
jgi:hypothetical protein